MRASFGLTRTLGERRQGNAARIGDHFDRLARDLAAEIFRRHLCGQRRSRSGAIRENTRLIIENADANRIATSPRSRNTGEPDRCHR